jgi:methylenetetrahydrofolate dehydrogenase (NADP+) / methenyltetrahydrofolate cyclohydrolase
MTHKLSSTHAPALKQLQHAISAWTSNNRQPMLAIIQVGHHPASNLFIRNKKKQSQLVGIQCLHNQLPETTTTTAVHTLITQYNADPKIDGIILQLPLPPTLNTLKLLQTIKPSKDVDGLNPLALGLLTCNQIRFPTCVAQGVMQLLLDHNIQLKGMHCVVIGASPFVGKPIMMRLTNAQATVTLCHEATQSLASHIAQAQLIISAIGKPNILKNAWFNQKHIIVDVGIHLNQKQKLAGDINHQDPPQCAALTPVPGGIGPMTVLALLQNTFAASKNHLDHS